MSRPVLVVDDNVDNANSLTWLLQLTGHQVLTAYDGAIALEMARQRCPRAVVLDLAMPRMSGLELARQLRRERGMEKALLIAVSGYGMQEDRQRSLGAGCDAHLVKPLDVAALEGLLTAPCEIC
jgi:CheY-like chemotaxis protein